MPFTPFVFDDSITKTDEMGVRVREGEYLLTITGARPTAEDVSGTTGAFWGLRIKDGPDGIGKSVDFFTTFSGKSTFSMGRLMVVCGFNPAQLVGKGAQTYEQFVQLVASLSKNLTGRDVGGSIGDGEPKNGKIYSQVFGIYAASEYPERSKTNALPRPAQTPATSATPQAAIEVPADFNAQIDDIFAEDQAGALA